MKYLLHPKQHFLFFKAKSMFVLFLLIFNQPDQAFATSAFPAQIIEEQANYTVDHRGYSMTVKRRIEILTDAGLEYGNITIPFYHHKTIEKVLNIQARIFNGEDDQKVLRQNIHITKLNDYSSEVSIHIPNTQIGSIIEYEYTLTSNYIVQLREWAFQHEIPTLSSIAILNIPSTIAYAYLLNGTREIHIDSKKIFESTSNMFSNSSGLMVTLSLNDVEALVEEPFVSSIENYRTSVRFQLDHIYVRGTKHEIIPSWKKLAQEVHTNAWMGSQYTKKSNHKLLLKELIPIFQTSKTTKEKVVDAYDFILNRVAWNGIVHAQTNKKIDDSFIAGNANSGELNLMMMVALKALDIDWFPVLASTADNGVISEQYPLFSQFNHILILAIIDGQETFIDLYSPFGKLGEVRASLSNTKGWVADQKNHRFIDFQSGRFVHKSIINIAFHSLDTASANIKWRAADYAGTEILYNRDNRSCEDVIYAAFGLSDGDTDVTNCLDHRNKKVDKNYIEFEAEVHSTKNIALAGSNIFYTPLWNTDKTTQAFKLAARTYPIEFKYLENEFIKLNIRAPEGYAVSSAPQSEHITLDGDLAVFRFTSAIKKDQSLDLIFDYKRNQSKIEAYAYPVLKEFFSKIESKLNEPVVFTRNE